MKTYKHTHKQTYINTYTYIHAYAYVCMHRRSSSARCCCTTHIYIMSLAQLLRFFFPFSATKVRSTAQYEPRSAAVSVYTYMYTCIKVHVWIYTYMFVWRSSSARHCPFCRAEVTLLVQYLHCAHKMRLVQHHKMGLAQSLQIGLVQCPHLAFKMGLILQYTLLKIKSSAHVCSQVRIFPLKCTFLCIYTIYTHEYTYIYTCICMYLYMDMYIQPIADRVGTESWDYF